MLILGIVLISCGQQAKDSFIAKDVDTEEFNVLMEENSDLYIIDE